MAISKPQKKTSYGGFIVFMILVAIAIGIITAIVLANKKDNGRPTTEIVSEMTVSQEVSTARFNSLTNLGVDVGTANQVATIAGKPDMAQINDIKGFLRKWDDANQLAASTGRIALATPVASMQSIKRDFETKAFTDKCSNIIKEKTNSYFANTISSFLEFMKGSEYESSANDYQLKATDERKQIDVLIGQCTGPMQ